MAADPTIGSTLSTLKTLLNHKLGNTSLGFFTADVRTDAINEGREELMMAYDWPRLIVAETVKFAGVGTAYVTNGNMRDVTTGGTYTGTGDIMYLLEIDGTAPDTFKWSDDDGSTYTTGVAITGAAQTLNNGVTVTFANTTGHTSGDAWEFLATDDTGKTSLPPNYHHYLRLFDSGDTTWEKVSPEEFDDPSDETWTIKDDSGSLQKGRVRRMYVSPTSTTSLTLRYMMILDNLSEESDQSGFETWHDKAIVYGAMWKLAERAGDTEWVSYYKAKFYESAGKAWQDARGEEEGHLNNRLRSAYEDKTLLNKA